MTTENQDASDISSEVYISGDISWSPTFSSLIRDDDNDYTEVDLDYGDQSEWLEIEYGSFGASSTDQIDSVTVHIKGVHTGLQHQSTPQVRFSDDNGTSWCSGHYFTNFGSTETTKSIACSHHSWDYNSVDDIRVQYRTGSVDEDNITYKIDYSYLTVVYSEIAPNVPTNFSASLNPYNNLITASWTASTGTAVSNYTVDYNGTTTTTSSTSINITVTDLNTAYAVKVRANGTDNSSAYTSTVTTDYTLTQDIENADFTVTPLREDGFVLNWKNLLNGVTNWKVEQYNGSSWTTLTTASATSFTYKVTGLDNTIEYKFRLSASNGDSVYSAKFKEVS